MVERVDKFENGCTGCAGGDLTSTSSSYMIMSSPSWAPWPTGRRAALILSSLLLWRALQAMPIWGEKDIPKRWGIPPDSESGGIRLSLVIVDSHFYWLGHHSRAAVIAHSWRIVNHCQIISISLALSQAPVYTARPDTWLLHCACFRARIVWSRPTISSRTSQYDDIVAQNWHDDIFAPRYRDLKLHASSCHSSSEPRYEIKTTSHVNRHFSCQVNMLKQE